MQRKALANSDTTSLRPRTNEAAVSVGVCLCKECVWFFVFVHVCVWVEKYVHVSVGKGDEGIGVGGCGMYRCVWEGGGGRCGGMCTCIYTPSVVLYPHAYTCLRLRITKM